MPKAKPLDTKMLAEEIAARLHALPDRKTAHVREVRREYSRRLTEAAPSEVVALAVRLLSHPGFESRLIAYEIVSHHRAALGSLRARELERLGIGMASWEAVDTFSCYLAGPAWREKQVPDKLICDWARSPDRWQRRAALVCTVALNNKARGGRGDQERTLAICRMLVADADDMVVKAMSWALRELAKRDPSAVHGFLAEHEGILAKRILREARNKLSTGLKNPRR